MTELPTGTVTFLFTDIEGSTQLLKRLGERYGEVLAQHQRIIREAAVERGGREIDTQGDSFFFAFPRANAALGAAVVAQRALAAHDWPEGGEVRVRMGLHTGEPFVGDERYVGIGVHRAARIGAIGHGGQVLLSNATRELVEDDVSGVSVRDLGAYRLKDIDRPERLCQLDIEGLATAFPPLKAQKVAEPSRVSRRTLLAAAVVGVLAAAIAIPIFAFGQGGSDGKSLDAAAGNSLGIVDSQSGKLVGDVAVGTTPTDVMIGGGGVWVTNSADGTVDRVDPGTRTVRQTIGVAAGPQGIAFGDGSVWVANGAAGSVSRIDPGTNAVIGTTSVGNGPSGIAFGAGSVWVANRDDHTLSRIDPASGKAGRPIGVGIEPLDVAAGVGGVWVTSAEGKVLHVDPRSGSIVESVGVGRRPTGVALGFGSVWVANSVDGTVSRIDLQSSAVVATIEVGEGPSGIAVGPDSIWVANELAGSVSRVDPESNAVVETTEIGGSPVGLAVGPDGIFVAVRPSGGTHRGGTLVVFSTFPDLGTLDPAFGTAGVLSITATNDGLTAFKRVGGQEGTQIVPNLATTLPVPTDGGRTYVFTLRRGIRYSTGRLVRAEDFRHSLERHFVLNPDEAGPVFGSIVGADACAKRPKACDLSRGIVTANGRGQITIRLTKPDADLLAKLALPTAVAVPRSVPKRDVGSRPVPATGPYVIAGYSPQRQVRLVRNPRFRIWSRAARPDAYPDEIVIKMGVPTAAQIKAVERGEADLADLTSSGESQIARLAERFGGRVRSDPGPLVVYAFLNTRAPPFDDVRVRRALNLAVNREAVVSTFGGPIRASATCQVLPINYYGYRKYCPYERNLAEAKRLVSASGTRGMRVVVWTRKSYARFYTHVVRALRDLGYRARLKIVDDLSYYDELFSVPRQSVQAGYLGWAAGLPTPAEFVTSLLGFAGDTIGFSDPAITRAIARALDLQTTDPPAAVDAWVRVDRMMVDRAFLVPLYNVRAVNFVSTRVGNYQLQPFTFVLLDQLWVR